MKRLHFSIQINAMPKKVWHIMLDDASYREWTSVFNPGSYYEGSWEKGSKILFLGPSDNGKDGGMVSQIADSRPFEFLSIKHLGIIENGVEDTTSEEAKKWNDNAYEKYTFRETNGGTELQVDVDVDDEHVEMFNRMWPEALQKLKELTERQ